jgi:hypothetical protein
MRKVLFIVSLLCAVLVYSSSVLANPAAPITLQILQPDGTKFKAKLKGDERYHWYETEAGNISLHGRNTQGVKLMDVEGDDKIVSIGKVAERD